MPSLKVVAIAAAATLAGFVSAAPLDRLDARIVDPCAFSSDPASCYQKQEQNSKIYGNMPTTSKKLQNGANPELNARIVSPCSLMGYEDKAAYSACQARVKQSGIVY